VPLTPPRCNAHCNPNPNPRWKNELRSEMEREKKRTEKEQEEVLTDEQAAAQKELKYARKLVQDEIRDQVCYFS